MFWIEYGESNAHVSGTVSENLLALASIATVEPLDVEMARIV